MDEYALMAHQGYHLSDLPQNILKHQKEERPDTAREVLLPNRGQVALFHEFLKPMLGARIEVISGEEASLDSREFLPEDLHKSILQFQRQSPDGCIPLVLFPNQGQRRLFDGHLKELLRTSCNEQYNCGLPTLPAQD